MDSLQRYQKRLRDEVAAVEKEIQSHNQQLAALNQRLEGLKRAVELFESEQSAMVELLRTNTPLAEALFRDAAIASAAQPVQAGASDRPWQD
jgi:predicted  nucleic acid-binding Zn-ribbon protein